MSLERLHFYENLRRSNYRLSKESWSVKLEREYEREAHAEGRSDPYKTDPAMQAAEAAMRKALDAGDMPEYRRLSAVRDEAAAAVWLRIRQAAEPETVQVVSEPVMETATPSASVTETARPEPAPVVEKRPISAIRAEVCRVANRLRIENAWSRSMSMREAWAMVKSGRAMFLVKGTSFNGRQEALKRLTQYKPQQVHAMLVPEPENEFDRNAVAVKVLVNGAKSLYTVGYIPAADTGKAKALIGRPVQLELIGNDDIRGARIAIAL